MYLSFLYSANSTFLAVFSSLPQRAFHVYLVLISYSLFTAKGLFNDGCEKCMPYFDEKKPLHTY